MGITIDDNNSKADICVTKDDRTSFGTFYDEITLSSTADANTVLDRWYEWTDSTLSSDIEVYSTKILYNYGETVDTYDSAKGVRTGFHLPQLDLVGGCDFSSFAVFGVGVNAV